MSLILDFSPVPFKILSKDGTFICAFTVAHDTMSVVNKIKDLKNDKKLAFDDTKVFIRL